MRILMLSQFYPPILGGIERHVQSLSTALVERGHLVSVATLWHPGQAEIELDGAVKVYRLHATVQRFSSLFSVDRFHAPPLPDPEVMLGLRRVIEQEKPEIIHAHNWIVHSFLPLKRWSGAKLVMTLHNSEMTCVQMRFMYMDQVLCSGPGPVKCLRCAAHHYGPLKGAVTVAGDWLMQGFERSAVDVFLPVSRAVAETNGLNSNHGIEQKVRVVPNFIPDQVAEIPVTGHSSQVLFPNEPYILQVGDLVPDKGIYILLEAYQALQPAPPLLLVGRRTQDSPRDLPPGVTVLESLPHEQVMEAWHGCLFGVVPSLCIDAFPTVTLEAMASGRAVIGSRIGGIVDQISDEKTGFLVEPGDVDGLRKAMQCLLDEPERRERMGAAARESVKAFQASAVVNQIEGIYRSL